MYLEEGTPNTRCQKSTSGSGGDLAAAALGEERAGPPVFLRQGFPTTQCLLAAVAFSGDLIIVPLFSVYFLYLQLTSIYKNQGLCEGNGLYINVGECLVFTSAWLLSTGYWNALSNRELRNAGTS